MIAETSVKSPQAPAGGRPARAAGGERFYPQLNGLRFLFIFMVLVHHWGPQGFFEQYRPGWLGVDLFFVLSGFLIGEILLVEKERSTDRLRSITNFMMRRVLRIFPLYYLVVLLYAAFVTTGGILLWNLTYTNNILQAIDLERVSEEFWHLWSLCVEEQFYLVFPFFILFVRRRAIPYFLVAGIATSLAGRFVATAAFGNPTAYTLMPLCLDSLFAGVLLAYLKTHRPASLQRFFAGKPLVAAAMAVTAAAIVTVCYTANELAVYTLFRLLGSGLGFLLIGYSVTTGYGGAAKAFLENGFVSLLGKISYGIYLFHPFIETLYKRHEGDNAVRNFLIGLHKPIVSNTYVIDFTFLFLATVAISYLSFHLFEKRFLKLKRLYSS